MIDRRGFIAGATALAACAAAPPERALAGPDFSDVVATLGSGAWRPAFAL